MPSKNPADTLKKIANAKMLSAFGIINVFSHLDIMELVSPSAFPNSVVVRLLSVRKSLSRSLKTLKLNFIIHYLPKGRS